MTTNKLNLGTELIKRQMSIKEINLVTKDILKKQKDKKLFSLEKTLTDISKYLVSKAIHLTQEELCDLALEEIADEIETLYPSGIESVIENHNHIPKQIKANCMAFYINCTSDFRRKYSFFDRINLACTHFDSCLKYNNDPQYFQSNSAKLDHANEVTMSLADSSLEKGLDVNKIETRIRKKPTIFVNNVEFVEEEDIDDDQYKVDDDVRLENWEITKKMLKAKMKETLKNKVLLFKVFENFEVTEKILLNKLISRQVRRSAKKLRESSPREYYCNNFVLNTLENVYYEFTFEDMMITLVRLIKFITELDVSLNFSDDLSLMLCFFAKDEVIELLAQKYHYEMQLKNYGAYYLGLSNKYRSGSNTKSEKDVDEPTQQLLKSYVDKEEIENLSRTLPQLYELNEDVVINYPPYIPFELEKKNKFARYANNDEVHACPYDPELRAMEDFMMNNENNYESKDMKENKDNSLDDTKNNINNILKDKDLTINEKQHYLADIQESFYSPTRQIPDQKCCSKFRSIDRLRMIFRAVDSMISFKELTKAGIFNGLIYQREIEGYGDEISFDSTCVKPLNAFDFKIQLKFINFVRNFYGEKHSFYFLFIHSLMVWMIVPAILGIAFFIFMITYTNFNESDMNFLVKVNVNDVFKLVFCGFITIWATLFINAWAQTEEKYSYFWGTDNFESQEPTREDFIPDGKEVFIFDHKISTYDKVKGFFKTVLSYTVIILIISITIWCNYLLFKLKAAKANEKGDSALYWQIIIGSMNSILIKVMSFIYKQVTTIATEWENYPTQTQYENSLSLKFIFFEFINNYSALIYIAFFKEIIEGICANNDCNEELNIQIYMVLATNLAINLIELGTPYIMMYFRKKKYIEKTTLLSGGKEVKCYPFTPEYQHMCDEYSTNMSEYIEVIILFGYVSLFSVACPLTPFFVMILLYFEKFVDACKLFYLSRVTNLDRADGIEVFRLIFKIIYFIGMVTSIALVLFTQQTADKYSLVVKIVIFAGVENLILIMMLSLKFNTLPSWFENLSLLKMMYAKKFVTKSPEHLPHHLLKGTRSLGFLSNEEVMLVNEEKNEEAIKKLEKDTDENK